ncbi:tetratricopeptide repeat protein [Pseudomonas sp. TH43]|uniref:tetratricopeptide repeat protein n=1 Tax=Pseudomonas sp. TH43 TaxID=2796407 RepID=UPI001912CB0A|nr:tetratricopeptide repeat protein [Pseudomonas sp. TH43]MBK5377526.1 tetratricopeptide repeat protein [Pseudomonas sp. TH43]
MNMFSKARVVSVVFFMACNSFVWGAQEASVITNSKLIKDFEIDLVPGFSKQKILISKGSDSAGEILNILAEKDGSQFVISRAPLALPNIKNEYSPASYDGFDVAVLRGAEKLVSVSGVQGEDLIYNDQLSRAGDIVDLVTKEEDNSQSNFNVQFQYDASLKKIVVSKVLLVTSNNACDRSIMSVYALPSNDLMSVSIEDFDGAKAFEYLKKLRLGVQTAKIDNKKLSSVFVTLNFEKALAAFKAGDRAKLKELMGNMLADGGSSDSCTPDSYIAEKYYYPGMVQWSNDLGFLFSEAGFYQEAIELLKVVVAENPDRTVAYLNLADAYWGEGLKELSVENYKKYSLLMQQSGKAAKVPKRVGERI